MTARLLPLIALAAVAIGAWFLHARPEQVVDASPGCAVQRATGLLCPGCGGSRAASHLAQGEIRPALRDNALIIVAVPLLVYLLVAQLVRGWTKRRLPGAAALGRTFWIVLVSGVILFTILRNIPTAPFHWLAP